MMRPDDLFSIGVNNLVKRKLRTFLTLLGVIIGTAAIVVLVSLSNGMDESFKNQIEQMGSLNNIDVMKPYGNGPGPSRPNGAKLKLDDKAVKTLEAIPHVEAVLPVKETYMRIWVGRQVADKSIIGTDLSKLEIFGAKLLKGHSASAQNTVVFGFSADQDFYNPRDQGNMGMMGGGWTEPPKPGEEVPYKPKLNLMTKLILTADYDYPDNRNSAPDQKKAKKFKAKGVGVLSRTGNYSIDYSAYVSLKTLKQMIKEDAKLLDNRDAIRNLEQYDRMIVRVDNIDYAADVQQQIKAMGYEANSLMDIINEMKKTSQVMKLVLGGIGAVSLLVAAIGIANTMVMSIYERTREIGVMKVIGADLVDIRNIFLVESGLIGLTGGIIGVILSYGVSAIINMIAGSQMGGQQISLIDFKLVLFGIAFSTGIGLISGYSPANRAMKLSVLNALRNNA